MKFCRASTIRVSANAFNTLAGSIESGITPAARAAVDIALHDAFTKHLDISLAKFLGQEINSLPTSVTIGIKNVEDTIEEAKEYHGLGFRVLKVKTGHSVDIDIERMFKLKETFGKEMTIRVDANQGYSRNDLDKFYQATSNIPIELIEQPVPADAIDMLKALPENIKKLIAADESLKSPYDAFNLANAPSACGIFNIKLMKSGGVYPGMQIANIAKHSNTELMWGCNDESSVSITAALHAALSSSMTRYIDLDGSLDLEVDVVNGGFTIENGYMRVTDAPGLGLTLIEENI